MFKKWFSKKGKAIVLNTASPAPVINPAGNITVSSIGSGYGGSLPTYTINSGVAGSGYVYNAVTSSPYVGTGNFTVGTNLHNSASVVSFYNNSNTEIVRLNKDGTITWGNGINVDEAAEAFGRAVSLGAEMQAGITAGAKRRMRDSVFLDLIGIANEKGSLTADDLTYLLEASKIIEKLKGGKE